MFKFLAIFLLMISSAQACLEDYEKPKATASLIKPSETTADEICALAKLVNAAYLEGEEGICLPNMERTSPNEIRSMIQNNELIGLRVDNSWKGCVHVGLSPYDDTKKSGLFGMLAVAGDPQYRGQGYGTLLVQSAESWAKDKGFTHMMLELIQPITWVQPHKQRLENWYIKRGYVHIDTQKFPHPEVLIPQEYVFKIFRKDL